MNASWEGLDRPAKLRQEDDEVGGTGVADRDGWPDSGVERNTRRPAMTTQNFCHFQIVAPLSVTRKTVELTAIPPSRLSGGHPPVQRARLCTAGACCF